MPRHGHGLAYIGSTASVLACMFPARYEAHVVQWRRWKFLYERGIVDASSVVLTGRLRGQRFVSER